MATLAVSEIVSVKKNPALNGLGKKYKHNGAWSYVSLDKKSTACYGERFTTTPYKYDLPEIGEQVVIYERVTHERMEDTYKERFSRRDLADTSKPVTWTVVGFSKGNDRASAMRSNNHIYLKRVTRSGSEVMQSFPTVQVVVGVIKMVSPDTVLS